MNAERLHAIAIALKKELDEGSPSRLQELCDAMRQQVQNPNQPAYAETVGRLRIALLDQLRSAGSNEFSPAWRQSLNDLHVSELLGNKLADKLEAIFTRNEITLSAAVEELQPLSEGLSNLASSVDNLLDGLAALNVGAEVLPAGEFEIGFLIPRRAVNQGLRSLGKEFEDIQKSILGPFYEIAIGGRPEVQVRSIGSSDFQVYLCAASGVAAMLAYSVDRILGIVEKIYKIRLAHKELTESGVSEETLDSVSSEADKVAQEDIELIADELLVDAQVDNGRKNELRVELKYALNGLANRLDAGYNVEVRVGELPVRNGSDDVTDDEAERLQRHFETVKSVQGRLTFLDLPGEGVLSLPESTEHEDAAANVADDDGGTA